MELFNLQTTLFFSTFKKSIYFDTKIILFQRKMDIFDKITCLHFGLTVSVKSINVCTQLHWVKGNMWHKS